jgi:hypothetical protein
MLRRSSCCHSTAAAPDDFCQQRPVTTLSPQSASNASAEHPGLNTTRAALHDFLVSTERQLRVRSPRISRVTQRDGDLGRACTAQSYPPAPRRPVWHPPTPSRRSAGLASGRCQVRWMIPGWRPSPGPGPLRVSRHPAVPEPVLSARRHPGAQARVPAHPLRRNPRPTSPPGRRVLCGMHDGRGCQRHGNLGKTLSAVRRVRLGR